MPAPLGAIFCGLLSSPAPVGSPPAVAPVSYQTVQGGNLASHTLTIPPGDPLPPNTRALVIGISSWKGFGPEGEPQTITSLPITYEGNAMNRLDGFGNVFYIGNDGGTPNDVGPGCYVFVLLSSPTFSIPTSGTISWTFNLSAGSPELHMASAYGITHPDRDLVASAIGRIRPNGNIASSNVPATADDNSVALSFSTFKRQVTPTPDPNWALGQLAVVDNLQDIQSGRHLSEARVFAAGGDASHVTAADIAGLRGSVTVQLRDPLGASTPAAGVRTGPAINIGATETSAAAINANVLAAQATFEAEIRALNDRGKSDAQIIAENPGFTTLTGKSLSDLVNALSSSRRLFLTANGGVYDWGTGSLPDFDDIELVGLADDGIPDVILGGTAKDRSSVRWPIRGQGGRVEGFECRDSALCFSFMGASGIIPRMDVQNCKFTRTGNSVHHEFGGGNPNVNANTGCSAITFRRNICEDVGHGFNMRCGPGYGETGSPPASADFQVGSLDASENVVKDFANMGIACHLDTRGGDSASVFWPGIASGSVGTADRNVIDGSDLTITGFGGFPINLTACETDNRKQNFVTRSNNPSGVDFDFYTKANNGTWEDNVVWDTGISNNFQGILGLKGEGNPGQQDLGTLTIRNNLVGHSTSFGNGRVIFVQRKNVVLDSNIFVTVGTNGVLTQQSGGDYNLTSRDNLYKLFGGFNQSAGVQVSAGSFDWLFEDDTFESYIDSTHNIIQFRNSNSRDNLDPTCRRVIFRKLGSGPVTAVAVAQSGASVLRDPLLDACAFEGGIDTALNVSGGTVTGSVTIQDSTHSGNAPNIVNSTGSTLNQPGNSF